MYQVIAPVIALYRSITARGVVAILAMIART
jgi:hypothetical protein